ncbi:MAG: 5-(carboxyamino)imidazole ribonucleotide synthase [Ilumatobacter sp.]
MNGPVAPPATIGMLGGGQLGKYALLAANTFGFRTIVVDPSPDAPAGVIAHEHIVAAYDDPSALDRLATECTVVTTEFENAPAAALAQLSESISVWPDAQAVEIVQDRIAEKTFLASNQVPVGTFAPLPVAGGEDALYRARAVAANGAIVKTARLGYDGKGQVRMAPGDDLAAAWDELGRVDCIVESLLELRTEISVLVARTLDGVCTTWPVAENIHRDGILDVSIVPARIGDQLASGAAALAIRVADALDYVGVMAVEMFVVADDRPEAQGLPRLLVNEIAPRPHNSGHWTLDACRTSQFEQQIRTVCDLGLGSTDLTVPAVAMVNLLGDLWFRTDNDDEPIEPDWAEAFDDPDASLHLYGKTAPRRGRKMGHLTVVADAPSTAVDRAMSLRRDIVTSPDDARTTGW